MSEEEISGRLSVDNSQMYTIESKNIKSNEFIVEDKLIVQIPDNSDKHMEEKVMPKIIKEFTTNDTGEHAHSTETVSAVIIDNINAKQKPEDSQKLTNVTTNYVQNNLHINQHKRSLSNPTTPLKISTEEHPKQKENILMHVDCIAKLEKQRIEYEHQFQQMHLALQQKESVITSVQRENNILEKEKQALRKERDLANKEKESTVIKFAMKEKLLIDAKKEKDAVEKQLADAKKEIKNISIRFQALHEEKSRITYIIDEKCNELRKYQRECEKLKTDNGHLDSKLKYHINKLNMEIEAKSALEKKLEEERNAPNKLEEKANEKLKMEYEANTILLKHDVQRKAEIIDNLSRENAKMSEIVKQLQEQLNQEKDEKNSVVVELEILQEEHNSVQNALSNEMLSSAKLRGQVDEMQVLKTQNTLNEEKIKDLNARIKEFEERLQDNEHDLENLHAKEQELLSINKEMSESIVGLQNETCLLKSKCQALEADNCILRREKLDYDTKYEALEVQLKNETDQKTEERLLLTKRLSEKTKLYEMTKVKLENVIGDFEAIKNKHATVIKELQRELQKYKKSVGYAAPNAELATAQGSVNGNFCSNCRNVLNGHNAIHASEAFEENSSASRTISRNSNQSGQSSRRPSGSSESETVTSTNTAIAIQNDLKGPSKKHLVERILRLQQASARQTEKIDFLENHTLSLVAELQKKSKVVQYYMMRDQAGALTSSKSDQNKSELAKYGNGVMSAIYGGMKGDDKSMTLELSLEINRKLQAVLEDTLLKNITLKENLDVLGLEVDNLTRKLRQIEAKE